jgi:protein-tyrosine phosphatase
MTADRPASWRSMPGVCHDITDATADGGGHGVVPVRCGAMSRAPTSSEPFERHLHLAGTRNLRDIGGYPAGAGRQTRWRTVFRTDALDQLPADSQAALIGLGVRQAIDLRFASEIEAWPSVFRDSSTVRYVSVPLHEDRPAPPGGVAAGYCEILDTRGGQFAAVGRALLEPGSLPAVVSCAGGIDRTGLTIAIVLSAVGVPADIVAADYALSATSFAGHGRGSGLSDWRRGPVHIDCLPEYMLAALDHLATRHGGATAFLARHGLAAADIARLRELLTVPTADEAEDERDGGPEPVAASS